MNFNFFKSIILNLRTFFLRRRHRFYRRPNCRCCDCFRCYNCCGVRFLGVVRGCAVVRARKEME